MDNFQANINIKTTPADAYRALTSGIPQWWSKSYTGSADNIGNRFTVNFDNTFKAFEVAELTEKQIAWRCVDSYLDLNTLDNKSEWNGTVISWNIKPAAGHITLEVIHNGLTPAIGCYEACINGWEHFLQNSLVPYLETGKGAPYTASA